MWGGVDASLHEVSFTKCCRSKEEFGYPQYNSKQIPYPNWNMCIQLQINSLRDNLIF